MKMHVSVFVALLVLAIAGCVDPDSSNNGPADSGQQSEYGFTVAIVDARFMPMSLGKHRLFVEAKLTNETEPEDLSFGMAYIDIITDGAGAISPTFQSEEDLPGGVELCPSNNNGRLVPTSSSYQCGFIVESETAFTPLRLRYSTDVLRVGPEVEVPFPEDVSTN